MNFADIIFDADTLERVQALYQKLGGQSITDIVLVGIGGSHLGAQAVYDALCAHPYTQPRVRLHAVTTVDSWQLADFEGWYTRLLQEKQVMTFVVSKSGSTFETASQAAYCFELLKKVSPTEYRNRLCVITDYQSPLWYACQQENLQVLPIPVTIGGRYSIFSVAGLAPLRFLGVDIQELLAGARAADVARAHASAQQLYRAFLDGYCVYDTFVFMPNYAALGGWTRQLMGESLGKHGKGFLPTVSLGSQDLHSVIQQYFGGKQMTFTSFLIPQDYPERVSIPANIFQNQHNVSFDRLQQAIIDGVLRAYQQREKPFVTFEFHKGSAFDIGRYLQYKMHETVMLGQLLGVNPFDQPEVELYKRETRALLKEI